MTLSSVRRAASAEGVLTQREGDAMEGTFTVTIPADSIAAARELYAEYTRTVLTEADMEALKAKHTALQTALSVLFPQGLPGGVSVELCPDRGYVCRVDILRRMLDTLGLSRLIASSTTGDEYVTEAMRRG